MILQRCGSGCQAEQSRWCPSPAGWYHLLAELVSGGTNLTLKAPHAIDSVTATHPDDFREVLPLPRVFLIVLMHPLEGKDLSRDRPGVDMVGLH